MKELSIVVSLCFFWSKINEELLRHEVHFLQLLEAKLIEPCSLDFNVKINHDQGLYEASVHNMENTERPSRYKRSLEFKQNRVFYNRRVRKIQIKNKIRKKLVRKGEITTVKFRYPTMKKFVRGLGKVTKKSRYAKKNLRYDFKKNKDLAPGHDAIKHWRSDARRNREHLAQKDKVALAQQDGWADRLGNDPGARGHKVERDWDDDGRERKPTGDRGKRKPPGGRGERKPPEGRGERKPPGDRGQNDRKDSKPYAERKERVWDASRGRKPEQDTGDVSFTLPKRAQRLERGPLKPRHKDLKKSEESDESSGLNFARKEDGSTESHTDKPSQTRKVAAKHDETTHKMGRGAATDDEKDEHQEDLATSDEAETSGDYEDDEEDEYDEEDDTTYEEGEDEADDDDDKTREESKGAPRIDEKGHKEEKNDATDDESDEDLTTGEEVEMPDIVTQKEEWKKRKTLPVSVTQSSSHSTTSDKYKHTTKSKKPATSKSSSEVEDENEPVSDDMDDEHSSKAFGTYSELEETSEESEDEEIPSSTSTKSTTFTTPPASDKKSPRKKKLSLKVSLVFPKVTSQHSSSEDESITLDTHATKIKSTETPHESHSPTTKLQKPPRQSKVSKSGTPATPPPASENSGSSAQFSSEESSAEAETTRKSRSRKTTVSRPKSHDDKSKADAQPSDSHRQSRTHQSKPPQHNQHDDRSQKSWSSQETTKIRRKAPPRFRTRPSR